MTASILVIEDQEDLRWLLERTLSQRGFQVRTAATGQDGLSVARSETCPVLILDYQLPDMNGLDVLRELRAITPDVRVILITAAGTPRLREEALRAGAFAYFEKPFDVEELIMFVRQALG